MSKKKYLKIPVPISANTEYRLGAWQLELLARTNRIYKSIGPKGCTLDNIFGFNKFKMDYETRQIKYVYVKYKRSYFESAALLVKHGYLAPYYKCGYNGDKMGLIPADAPEAIGSALADGRPLEDHIALSLALKRRQSYNKKARTDRGGSDK